MQRLAGVHPQFDVASFDQGAERVQGCALLGCGNAPGQLPGQAGYEVLTDAHSSGSGPFAVVVLVQRLSDLAHEGVVLAGKDHTD